MRDSLVRPSRSVGAAQPRRPGLPRPGPSEPPDDDRDGERGGSAPAPRQDPQDGRDRADGRVDGHPEAQVRDARRGRDGGRRRGAGCPDLLSAHRTEPEAVHEPRPGLPQYDVPRHGGRSRLGPALSAAVAGLDRPVPVLVDLEIGMGRTGIDPGEAAAELYALVDRLPNLVADGLHAYDGHIHDTDVEERRKATQDGIERVLALRDRLLKRGQDVPRRRAGRDADLPDPCRAGYPRRRVLAGYDHAPRPELSHPISGPAVHAGGPAADPRDQPAATRPPLPRPGPQGRRRRSRPALAPDCSTSTMPGRSCIARSTSSSRRPMPTSSPSARRSSPSRPMSAPPWPSTAASTSSRTASSSAGGK